VEITDSATIAGAGATISIKAELISTKTLFFLSLVCFDLDPTFLDPYPPGEKVIENALPLSRVVLLLQSCNLNGILSPWL